jgi:hypothetical protein
LTILQILRDSLRLLRSTKLIWVLGLLLQILRSLGDLKPSAQFVHEHPVLYSLSLIVSMVVLVVYWIATCALIQVIYQASMDIQLTFSETRLQPKSKLRSLIGLLILNLPAGLVELLILAYINRLPSSPLQWLILLILISCISIYSFSMCAVLIDGVKAWQAVWLGFLITLNNFFRLIGITGLLLLIRGLFTLAVAVILASGLFHIGLPVPLALDYPTYLKLAAVPFISVATKLLDVFLYPLQTIILTLAYLKFTAEMSYPILAPRQTAA